MPNAKSHTSSCGANITPEHWHRNQARDLVAKHRGMNATQKAERIGEAFLHLREALLLTPEGRDFLLGHDEVVANTRSAVALAQEQADLVKVREAEQAEAETA